MKTITIQKSELKNLIMESLSEYFPKYGFVSNKEQKEIELLYKDDDFDKKLDADDFVEL